jgi:hypothetical protein
LRGSLDQAAPIRRYWKISFDEELSAEEILSWSERGRAIAKNANMPLEQSPKPK